MKIYSYAEFENRTLNRFYAPYYGGTPVINRNPIAQYYKEFAERYDEREYTPDPLRQEDYMLPPREQMIHIGMERYVFTETLPEVTRKKVHNGWGKNGKWKKVSQSVYDKHIQEGRLGASLTKQGDEHDNLECHLYMFLGKSNYEIEYPGLLESCQVGETWVLSDDWEKFLVDPTYDYMNNAIRIEPSEKELKEINDSLWEDDY